MTSASRKFSIYTEISFINELVFEENQWYAKQKRLFLVNPYLKANIVALSW